MKERRDDDGNYKRAAIVMITIITTTIVASMTIGTMTRILMTIALIGMYTFGKMIHEILLVENCKNGSTGVARMMIITSVIFSQ